MLIFTVPGWQDQYVIHNFSNDPMNIVGLEPQLIPDVAILHGHQITLAAHSADPLSPAGVFNWHYLQCVIKRFATSEYKEIENINFFTLPFRTEDDDESDFDFDDERNIANPPYPSYLVELAEARVRQRMEDAERNSAIAEWNSRVSMAM